MFKVVSHVMYYLVCRQEEIDETIGSDLEKNNGFIENFARGTAHMFRYEQINKANKNYKKGRELDRETEREREGEVHTLLVDWCMRLEKSLRSIYIKCRSFKL